MVFWEVVFLGGWCVGRGVSAGRERCFVGGVLRECFGRVFCFFFGEERGGRWVGEGGGRWCFGRRVFFCGKEGVFWGEVFWEGGRGFGEECFFFLDFFLGEGFFLGGGGCFFGRVFLGGVCFLEGCFFWVCVFLGVGVEAQNCP